MKQSISLKNKVPEYILTLIKTLQEASFEAQIVGGSVRDLLLGRIPNDWDINTNATPDQLLNLFQDSFYENEFGTVGVKVRDVTHETTEVVEITPYRKEGVYIDGRHPSTVSFKASLLDDLLRRDFTINAIAYDPIKDMIKDIDYLQNIQLNKGYSGTSLSLKDIESKIVRCVGNPSDRFNEDYLRLLRAVRFATQLNFTINKDTEKAIVSLFDKLSQVSRERVRDELIKIINSDEPMIGFLILEYTGLLNNILPELLLGKGMFQTKNHKYDVYGHLLRSMQHAADKKYSLELRIATLLHDIAKPHTARWVESTGQNSFHGHEVVGEKVSREILTRLKFPQDFIFKVCKLVRWHMFNSDPDQVTMSAVRRMIVNVGRENIWDLMNLRFCDRIGSGRPMEEPYRLRRYFAMIEKALTQPTDLKMLKIDGRKIIEVTHETPGPRIGLLLNALMGEVLENPELNTLDSLVSRVTELLKLDSRELSELAQKGKSEVEEVSRKVEKNIKMKFKV